jgi:hypothetical protein
MKRIAASLVAVAALLGSSLAGTALGQDTNPEGVLAAPQAFNAQQGWNDRSDRTATAMTRLGPERIWGSGQGCFNILEGWVADHGGGCIYNRRAFRGRGPMGDVLLKSHSHDQKPSIVRSRTRRTAAGDHARSQVQLPQPRQPGLVGQWRGSTLVVRHDVSRRHDQQTFAPPRTHARRPTRVKASVRGDGITNTTSWAHGNHCRRKRARNQSGALISEVAPLPNP